MDSAITQLRVFVFGAIAAFILVGLPNNASSQVTAFKQAIAEAASTDADIASFYKGVAYQSLWTGASDLEQQRRIELFKALSRAVNHGLPIAQYDIAGLRAQMKAANSPRERGLVEVEISRTFLQYVRDIQTGVHSGASATRPDSGLTRKWQCRSGAARRRCQEGQQLSVLRCSTVSRQGQRWDEEGVPML